MRTCRLERCESEDVLVAVRVQQLLPERVVVLFRHAALHNGKYHLLTCS